MLLCSSTAKTLWIWILFYIILTQPLVITNKFSTILVQQIERKHQIIFRWTYLTMCIKDVNLLSLEYSYFIIINPKISVKSYHLNKSVWFTFIGLDVLRLKISLDLRMPLCQKMTQWNHFVKLWGYLNIDTSDLN